MLCHEAHIFRYEQKEADLLRSLNDAEIDKEDETSTLFRGASLTTTIMDLYMKSVCTSFLQAALKDTISKLLDSKISCEVWNLGMLIICIFFRLVVLFVFNYCS